MGAHRAPEPDAPYRTDTYTYTPTIYPTGTTYAEPPAPAEPPTQYAPTRYAATPQYPATARTQRPSAVPVVLFTVLFGIFGSISASRRAKKAKAAGGTGTPYWAAFGITLVAVIGLQLALLALIMANAKIATPGKLEQSIVAAASGDGVHPTAASCAEAGVHQDGTGQYRCAITFSDGTHGTYTITVDRDGRWTPKR